MKKLLLAVVLLTMPGCEAAPAASCRALGNIAGHFITIDGHQGYVLSVDDNHLHVQFAGFPHWVPVPCDSVRRVDIGIER